MPWLRALSIPHHAQSEFSSLLRDLDAQLRDPTTDRNVLVRDLLAQFLYGRSYEALHADAPIAALNCDPRNVTLEAEYYEATDPEKFARVKPLLWLWKNFDLSPGGQSATFGIAFREVLARHVFRRVGRNFKCWQHVEFSVGYNMDVGDDVVVHRHVLLDDIGGIVLHDGVSISDYANVYSHSHSVLDMPDVTLRTTVLGRRARVTYHATVLAGSVISDDAMVATGALVRGPIPPHAIAMGVPARVSRFKDRAPFEGYQVDSRRDAPDEGRKANLDFPGPTPAQTRTSEPQAAADHQRDQTPERGLEDYAPKS
ncbi:acyltransferase [Deinococcus peraridilitoris]|uniref:Acetyltransferase (Isoleucine patch superfamily) n=1 Tax=Deinococcus peraridilitoris (strain DSM 19664 / LMG 22246 / CIP 109416 / KR-200) TaxID=937777 RepID=L0A407_DEIPD|nr:acyltransferase [Deinococcus peraridilitoris]AFZ67932.1 acetyltransferase (isoleucine patch superfamily) [Deinococcus peraridilitoris DSM 19664]